MTAIRFTAEREAPSRGARSGRLTTPHGVVATPALAAGALAGAVPALAPEELKEIGVPLLVLSAFRLDLRPGVEAVATAGGLHPFTSWDGPILAESGAQEILCLPPANSPASSTSSPLGPHGRLIRIDADGVTFRSPLDGSARRMTPEGSVALQETLGADLIVAFQGPERAQGGRRGVPDSLVLTLAWAQRCLDARRRTDQAMLGPVPLGPGAEEARETARALGRMGFDGFALLGQGERSAFLAAAIGELPPDRPRYFADIKGPIELLTAVEAGVDLMGSEAPSQLARRGIVYTPGGPCKLTQPAHQENRAPIDPTCRCYSCTHFSRAYLCHLFSAGELLGYRLAAIHNWTFVADLAQSVRAAILDGSLGELRRDFERRWLLPP